MNTPLRKRIAMGAIALSTAGTLTGCVSQQSYNEAIRCINTQQRLIKEQAAHIELIKGTGEIYKQTVETMAAKAERKNAVLNGVLTAFSGQSSDTLELLKTMMNPADEQLTPAEMAGRLGEIKGRSMTRLELVQALLKIDAGVATAKEAEAPEAPAAK